MLKQQLKSLYPYYAFPLWYGNMDDFLLCKRIHHVLRGGSRLMERGGQNELRLSWFSPK